MTDQPKPPGPSLRKRVLLTLYLMLPFLVLATLMYVLAFQLQKQGAELGKDRNGQHDETQADAPLTQTSERKPRERGDHISIEDPERIRKLIQELKEGDTAP